MSKHIARFAQAAAPSAEDDPLITSAAVRALAGGVSDMSLWRWVRDGIIPAPLYIRKRKYWKRSELIAALAAAAQPKLEAA